MKMKLIAGLLVLRNLLVLLLGIAIIFGGFYCGIWYGLIGGIVDIINQIKRPGGVDAYAIAYGIVKILFCQVPMGLGIWVGGIVASIGVALMTIKRERKWKTVKFFQV